MEIIPKPEIQVPPWQKNLFYFSIALLIGLILIFFILGILQKRSLVSFENIKTEISQEKTPQNLALEKEMKAIENKINAFSQISEEHYRVSKFFEELETLSHPRTWYSNFILNTETGELTISGLADNFTALGQQLLIFNNNPKILAADLSKVAIGKKGQIEFTFKISLDPSILK